MNTPEMDYEMFVRRAFGLALKKGGLVGRGEDPAEMADTDRYTDFRVNSLKAAVIYSMEIYSSHLREGLGEKVHEEVDGFLGKVMNAKAIHEVTPLIRDYQKRVIEQYFSFEKGILKAKKG
jgi:hypothetical protein